MRMSTLPASPARIRRAWRAGVRGHSAWLTTGIALVIAAVVLRAWTPGTIAERVRAAFSGDAASFASALAIDALGLAAAIAAIVVAAIVIASLLLGRFGPIEPALARGLA